MIIRIQNEDFDTVAVQQELVAGRSEVGAIASFIGLVRDLADNPLQQMTLEHYPGMTEKALERIADLACQRWQVLDLAIIHRVGALRPADQIVLVMVASAHRGDAFAACEFIMDYLKNEAPFWKKETSSGGEKWVEARKSDIFAQKKWDK
ncbi:MAG: molybdenum cofactor biosynthesis protein MoaE [Gammaproteobacteria bacterium]|nr:molybdenum cofactor biosynthesis protein MoaE [Gammaproteobacteria bacterium]MDH3535815.1 molybdenum cofactor biosynthesis protein MoaE [Gammaproteobacteria bacterium]